jgi:hypothetical protein
LVEETVQKRGRVCNKTINNWCDEHPARPGGLFSDSRRWGCVSPGSIDGLGDGREGHGMPTVGTPPLVAHLARLEAQPSPAVGAAEVVEHGPRFAPAPTHEPESHPAAHQGQRRDGQHQLRRPVRHSLPPGVPAGESPSRRKRLATV